MQDLIAPEQAGSLYGLFLERVRRTPDAVAYREFDRDRDDWTESTWSQVAAGVGRWRGALEREGLEPGDRVAILYRNGRDWVCFDQAALGLGLVVVPIYTRDRAENAAYILEHSGAKLLLVESERQWRRLVPLTDELDGLVRIVSPQQLEGDARLRVLAHWLPDGPLDPGRAMAQAGDLATIPYTSGTTGRPKGVMLSHHNILWDAWSASQRFPTRRDDVLLSFLPLSHMYERTIGYYVPMMAGAKVVYARSVSDLPEDLATVRPTALVSVPRIYERIHRDILRRTGGNGVRRQLLDAAVSEQESSLSARLAGPLARNVLARVIARRFGGRLRVALSGGAPLAREVADFFLTLSVPLVQGYGLTETSPVLSVNTLEDNDPDSAGRPIPGVEVRLGEDDELETRGPHVMLGYWRNRKATEEAIMDDGWFRTGDRAEIRDGRLYIKGRLKQVIVLATGENVPPADMETAITNDDLFEQAMIVGEGKPFLVALVVLNEDQWAKLGPGEGSSDHPAGDHGQAEELVLERIAAALRDFPGYAQVRRAVIADEPWSVENGLLTPTMKVRRGQVLERYGDRIERLYEEHAARAGA